MSFALDRSCRQYSNCIRLFLSLSHIHIQTYACQYFYSVVFILYVFDRQFQCGQQKSLRACPTTTKRRIKHCWKEKSVKRKCLPIDASYFTFSICWWWSLIRSAHNLTPVQWVKEQKLTISLFPRSTCFEEEEEKNLIMYMLCRTLTNSFIHSFIRTDDVMSID